jgi:periplasmic protein TonB
MNSNQILTADVLDIIFEGRNKNYGAYELRKTYNKRLITALISAGVFVALFFSGYLFAKNNKSEVAPIFVDSVFLADVKERKVEPPVVIPPKPLEVKPVQTVKLATPVIVTNKDVPLDEMPPEQKDIEDSKIGLEKITGDVSTDIVAPPQADGEKGIVAVPKKTEEEDERPFLKVEVESQYPGGNNSWIRFLLKSLSNYPEQALEKGIEGTVLVQFIVDREGNISDVQAISGPEELKGPAVNVIKKSGKWIPAIQNGRLVKSYKKQPITFRLSE